MIYSLFPEVLWWGSLLTPLIFRFAISGLFTHCAIIHIKHRRATESLLKKNGIEAADIVLKGVVAIEGLLAFSFLLGIYTQLAALLGILYSAVFIFYQKRHLSPLTPHTRSFYFLLAVVLLSLFFTGPGPLSFDLPL